MGYDWILKRIISYIVFFFFSTVMFNNGVTNDGNDNSVDNNQINNVSEAYSSDFISEIKALNNNDTLTFTWASDIHHQSHLNQPYGLDQENIKEMAELSDLVNSQFLIITGDIANGYFPVDEQKQDLIDVSEILSSNCNVPVMFVQGNHDDNSWYASDRGSSGSKPTGLKEVLSNSQFFSCVMKNSSDYVICDKDNPLGGYYYKDFEDQKIRVIVLNCEDIPYIQNDDLTLKYCGHWTMGFRQRQLEWLANEALCFNEEGWGILFFVHNDSNMPNNKQLMYNLNVITDLIDAAKRRQSGEFTNNHKDFCINVNYDFTSGYPAEVIAWFSGHIHKDTYEIVNGVPHITIINAFDKNSGGYDIVTVDRENRKIYLRRYKNGPLKQYNRTIDY